MACRQPTRFAHRRLFPLRPEPFSTSNLPPPTKTSSWTCFYPRHDRHWPAQGVSHPSFLSTLADLSAVSSSNPPKGAGRAGRAGRADRVSELIYARFLFISTESHGSTIPTRNRRRSDVARILVEELLLNSRCLLESNDGRWMGQWRGFYGRAELRARECWVSCCWNYCWCDRLSYMGRF